jgi:hypothetical protein
MLNGFVDSLLQSFENHRAGLTDAILAGRGEEAFFLALYGKEAPRLRETVRQQELALAEGARDAFFADVDEYVRRVVVPAYARLTGRFTRRERNDFYLVPEALHGVERLGWGVAGMLLGLFVVWAPFIPIWSKEWVLVFVVGGLVFPNLRRFFALRGYESALNELVAKADDEIWRKDLAYVTEGVVREAGPKTLADEGNPAEDAGLRDRLTSAGDAAPSRPTADRTKTREGGN